jgi:DNA-binding transcriptional MerR regulator
MRVKQLAQRYSLSLDTVRYYTRIGLLKPQTNPINGYKEYLSADQRRLEFIIQAKSLGFSLHDIETVIDQSKSGSSPCPTVREIIKARITETEEKIAAMQATCQQMKAALATWQSLPDCTPTGDHVCHLIEGLIDETANEELLNE